MRLRAEKGRGERVSVARVVVIGAGVAGLAAAAALRRRHPEREVVVLDAAMRAGGLVESEHLAGGFLLEHGADGFLTTKPDGLAAVRAAGLADDIALGIGSRRSFVAGADGLVPIPPVLGALGPREVLAFLRSPLLSPAGKVRAALEPLVRARRDDEDESVAEFATRRFGHELAGAVLDPLIGGIYGGDTRRLSVTACLPRLRELERAHGSVALGLQRSIRARRRRAARGEPPLPPLVTLRRGMGSLPVAMARGLDVRVGVGATALARAGAGFRVVTSHGDLDAAAVVVATPAWRAAPLFARLAPDLAGELAAVPHKAFDCVTLAWARRDVPHALDGTGWVRAAGDARPTLACTWASEKWPERAPRGFVLLRSVLALPGAGDDELVAAACRDLRDLVGVTAVPSFAVVRRLARATPIYELGHVARVARMERLVAELGAAALAGNAYHGVGIPDCVASGEIAASSVLAALAHGGTPPRRRATGA